MKNFIMIVCNLLLAGGFTHANYFTMDTTQHTGAVSQAAAGLPFTPGVVSGDQLYISGQIGVDSSGALVGDDFKGEAQQVMINIGHVLQQHNLQYRDLVNVTIYLTSMHHYAETNEVYLRYFEGPLPARLCVAVKELPKGAHIEIAGIAAVRR